MCRACLGLLYQSTNGVQPHAALKEEGAFSQQNGTLYFHVCTDKDCGTQWERSVFARDGLAAQHVWKVRSDNSHRENG
jgi:hypothetical protein